MEKSMRCLLLTSNTNGDVDAAEKYSQTIRRSGCAVRTLAVFGLVEFRQVLDEQVWDVALVDYALSPPQSASGAGNLLQGFNPETVLNMMNEHYSTVPVVFVVPSEQLQNSLVLMDQGALDCVRSDELFRLAPVLQREVSRAHHHTEMNALKQRHDMLLNSAAEGFWDWNLESGEMFFSERWLAMFGYDEQDFPPTFTSWLGVIHPEDLGSYLDVWSEYMEGKQRRFNVEYRMMDKSGDYRWVAARGVSVGQEGGEPVYLAGSLNDITQRKRVEHELLRHRERLEQSIAERTAELRLANEELSRLAQLDGLTEIPNRRCLDETLVRECSRVGRDGIPLTVLIIDIDYFKKFNDQFGHLVGDRCLKMVAAAIRQSVLRPSDIVARYGGEEFVVVLPNTNKAGGQLVYERIQEALACLSGLEINPTTSAGLASVDAGIKITPSALLASADKVLYQAKDAGRNCIKECVIGVSAVA